jgi:hypothetical protein
MCALTEMIDIPEHEKRAAVEQLSRFLRLIPVTMSDEPKEPDHVLLCR